MSDDVVDKYANFSMDFDDQFKDIKINPDLYIHYCLLHAQRTLMFSVMKSTASEGLLAYSVFIEQLEVLCKAAGYIEEDYNKEIEAYKKTSEVTNQERKDVRMVKIANKKLEILMTYVFGRTALHMPLQA